MTVSDLVADLLAEQLVEELGLRPEARVGKPATLVGMRADAAQILAIDLSDESSAIGAVVDLAGGVVPVVDPAQGGDVASLAADADAKITAALNR